MTEYRFTIIINDVFDIYLNDSKFISSYNPTKESNNMKFALAFEVQFSLHLLYYTCTKIHKLFVVLEYFDEHNNSKLVR